MREWFIGWEVHGTERNQRWCQVEGLGSQRFHWVRGLVEKIRLVEEGNEFTFSNICHYSETVHVGSLDFSEAQNYIADLRSEKAPALCLAPHLGLLLTQSSRWHAKVATGKLLWPFRHMWPVAWFCVAHNLIMISKGLNGWGKNWKRRLFPEKWKLYKNYIAASIQNCDLGLRHAHWFT